MVPKPSPAERRPADLFLLVNDMEKMTRQAALQYLY